jgi:hypothetical protein
MNTFCKSCVDTDLASLHCIICIEPFVVSPKEALFFDFEQFTSTSINKLIEPKDKDSFLIFEEHFFDGVLLHRKSYGVHFEDPVNEDLEYLSVQRPLTSGSRGWLADQTPWPIGPTLQPLAGWLRGDTLQEAVEGNATLKVSGGLTPWPVNHMAR